MGSNPTWLKDLKVEKKTIALVAHDSRKQDMVEWANYNKEKLSNFNLVGTKGTAKAIENISGLYVKSLGHGPDSEIETDPEEAKFWFKRRRQEIIDN